MSNSIHDHIDEKLSGLAADEIRRTRIRSAVCTSDLKKQCHKLTLKSAAVFSMATILLLSITVGALAYTVPDVNDLLYRVWPWAAQKLKPVCLIAEDQEIRMEVISAQVQRNEAWVYLAMQDLNGDRLDDTVDLFDSAILQLPYDGSGTCMMTGYDAENGIASFLAYMKFNAEHIEDGNVTFTVNRIISHKKKNIVNVSPMVDLTRKVEVSLPDHPVNGGGYTLLTETETYRPDELFGQVPVLSEADEHISVTEGIEMDGYGTADGVFHVRIRGKDNHRTDNHCFVAMTDKDGNELPHGMIVCTPEGKQLADIGSISWNENGDQITEWFFELPKEGAEGLNLIADCVTADPAIEGNWSVTFPLESIRME